MGANDEKRNDGKIVERDIEKVTGGMAFLKHRHTKNERVLCRALPVSAEQS